MEAQMCKICLVDCNYITVKTPYETVKQALYNMTYENGASARYLETTTKQGCPCMVDLQKVVSIFPNRKEVN